MSDERLDSMSQGMGVPPESPAAKRAARELREDLLRNPPPPMEGEMGGTSDADRPADEAGLDAALHRGLADDRTRLGGADLATGAGEPDPETLRETREASRRAQGGGSADEDDIRRGTRTGQD